MIGETAVSVAFLKVGIVRFMHILVLGGTQFVGRHMVEKALKRGHTLTLFNRGNQAGLFDVEERIGDRQGDLASLASGQWDAVIDVSGYVPRHVRLSAELLKNRCGIYCFISTVSVYEALLAPWQDRAITEDATLLELAEPTEDVKGDTYGALKVLCEKVVTEVFPNSHLILRPGVVVGPYDHTDRFSYWVHRVAGGGEMLTPGKEDTPIQYVDARDLASWTLACLEAKTTGIYNTVVPPETYSMKDLFEATEKVTNSSPSYTWVDEPFLTQQGVGPPELPMWPPEAYKNFVQVSSDAAVTNGFKVRSLKDTVKATYDYLQSLDEAYELKAGLKPEREKELLSLWQKETPPRGEAG